MADTKKTEHSYAWLLLIVPSGYILGSMLREAVMPCRMRAREAAQRLVQTDPRGSDGTANVNQAINYGQVNQNQNVSSAPINSGNGGNRFDNSDGMNASASFNV